jgi:hypothetical protein
MVVTFCRFPRGKAVAYLNDDRKACPAHWHTGMRPTSRLQETPGRATRRKGHPPSARAIIPAQRIGRLRPDGRHPFSYSSPDYGSNIVSLVYCALTFFIFLDRRHCRARLALAKERILECLVSLMRYVQNASEFGFAVQVNQQWVSANIGIAEETGFNAHSQHM